MTNFDAEWIAEKRQFAEAGAEGERRAFTVELDPPTILAILDELEREKKHYADEVAAMDRVEEGHAELVESLEQELARLKSQLETEGQANLMRIENDARVIERMRHFVECEASSECQYAFMEEIPRQQMCRGRCSSCEAKELLEVE